MRYTIAALVFAFVFVSTTAQAYTTVYRYVSESGVVSFADSKEAIPKKYRDAARTLTLSGGLKDCERCTVAVTPPHPRASRLLAVHGKHTHTEPKQECGTVRLRSERRDHDGYNTRFYIVEDDCGILFDAPFYPKFQVERAR
jgi:hypothetical protein